jgi:uncharacterized membrane protein YhhN
MSRGRLRPRDLKALQTGFTPLFAHVCARGLLCVRPAACVPPRPLYVVLAWPVVGLAVCQMSQSQIRCVHCVVVVCYVINNMCSAPYCRLRYAWHYVLCNIVYYVYNGSNG